MEVLTNVLQNKKEVGFLIHIKLFTLCEALWVIVRKDYKCEDAERPREPFYCSCDKAKKQEKLHWMSDSQVNGG